MADIGDIPLDRWRDDQLGDACETPAVATARQDFTARVRADHTKPNGKPHDPTWPVLDDAAYYGLAGDIVRAIEPTTEADPVALLAQLLVAVGNMIGPGPHFRVEDDEHPLVEDLLIVGKTAKARKGLSFNRVFRVTSLVDPRWAADRIVNGLSSGEGLIEQVKDPEEEKVQGDDKTVWIVSDRPNKRLLVQEAEFASVLKACDRHGNILSSTIRNAWDGRTLRTLTRNNPLKATGAHVSIIGHITDAELVRLLSTTEAANGFMNRFLIVLAKRSKVLPEGACLDDATLRPLQDRLQRAVEFARKQGRLQRDPDARAYWRLHYEVLSAGRPGLAGSILARAEAHVMRLACIYAVLDGWHEVRKGHLTAAMKLWDYCEKSVARIWGDTLGDPTADKILGALREQKAMTRTAIRDLFSGNKPSQEIERALALLDELKLAKKYHLKTEGRPCECWELVTR
jgi:hypothetical protein